MVAVRSSLVGALLWLAALSSFAAAPPVGVSKGPPPVAQGSPTADPPFPPITVYRFRNDLPWRSTREEACTVDYFGYFKANEACNPGGNWSNTTHLHVYQSVCWRNIATYNGCPGTPTGSTSAQNLGSGASEVGCPAGATLIGGVCVPSGGGACPAGSTAYGGTCWSCGPGLKVGGNTGAPDCLTDYESQCPYSMGTGALEWDFVPGMDTGGSICIETDNPYQSSGGSTPRKCAAIPTGAVTVCASSGCGSDQGRLTGATCTVGAGATPPVPPLDDCTGRDWCRNPGTCPAGYNAGDFQGESLCVVAGKVVAASVQSQEPGKTILPAFDRDPPGMDTNPIERGGIGGTDQLGNEGTGPGGRVVVSVGGATSTGAPGGGGNGSGTGGMGEIVTCGLPGTPACKIDETGTPTEGDFAAAEGELEKAKGDWEALIGDAAGTDGKNTDWSFSFALPTTCSAMSVAFPVVTFTIDPCEWRVWSDPLISIIWLSTTIWTIIGMVGRGIAGG